MAIFNKVFVNVALLVAMALNALAATTARFQLMKRGGALETEKARQNDIGQSHRLLIPTIGCMNRSLNLPNVQHNRKQSRETVNEEESTDAQSHVRIVPQ